MTNHTRHHTQPPGEVQLRARVQDVAGCMHQRPQQHRRAPAQPSTGRQPVRMAGWPARRQRAAAGHINRLGSTGAECAAVGRHAQAVPRKGIS